MRFAPLLLLLGIAGYWMWGSTATWHTAFRVGSVILGCALLWILLVMAFARVPRGAVAVIGALGYFSGVMYAQSRGFAPEIDWIWSTVIALGLALVGWWSFAGCYDALIGSMLRLLQVEEE